MELVECQGEFLFKAFIVQFSDALQAGASQFEASAGKLKRKFWWKNMKVTNSFLKFHSS